MSSFFPGKPGIAFKNPSESAFFEFTKKVFKTVPLRERSYDPDTKIWSFMSGVGAQVYKTLKESPLGAIGMKFEKIESLPDQVRSGYVKRPEKVVFDPSDFFYTPEPPKSIGPSRGDAELALARIFNMDLASLQVVPAKDLKKQYLRAALRLHPDRNAGDSSGMTELNYYWQVLNG